MYVKVYPPIHRYRFGRRKMGLLTVVRSSSIAMVVDGSLAVCNILP
jgi:hypothetical protein